MDILTRAILFGKDPTFLFCQTLYYKKVPLFSNEDNLYKINLMGFLCPLNRDIPFYVF